MGRAGRPKDSVDPAGGGTALRDVTQDALAGKISVEQLDALKEAISFAREVGEDQIADELEAMKSKVPVIVSEHSAPPRSLRAEAIDQLEELKQQLEEATPALSRRRDAGLSRGINSTRSVIDYYRTIAQDLPEISTEQMKQLADDAKHNREARTELVARHIDGIAKLASDWSAQGISEDVFQDAMIFFFHSVQGFNPEKATGRKPSTVFWGFAKNIIRSGLVQSSRLGSAPRVSLAKGSAITDYLAAYEKARRHLGQRTQEVTDDALLEEINRQENGKRVYRGPGQHKDSEWTKDHIELAGQIARSVYGVQSLDEQIDDTNISNPHIIEEGRGSMRTRGGFSPHDKLASEEDMESEVFAKEKSRVLRKIIREHCTEEEAEMMLAVASGLSQKEVAEQMGLSEKQVSVAMLRAKSKLRSVISEDDALLLEEQ